MKSLQREIVEDVVGSWPATGAGTDGWMRSALAALGIETRGQALSSRDLLALCHENGLDELTLTAQAAVDSEDPR